MASGVLAFCLTARAGAAGATTSTVAAAFDGRLSFKVFAEEQGLTNTAIECLLQDRVGFLWVGTQDGLFRFDGSAFLRFGRDEGLPSTRINALYEAMDGSLYASTRSGLAVRTAGRFQLVGRAQGLPELAIPDAALASSPDGSLFVGTPAGLHSGRADRFKVVPLIGEGTPSVTGLSASPSGTLFFGVGTRLLRRLPDGGVEDFGSSHGFHGSEPIDVTLTDSEGGLWVRTLTGLWVLPRGASRFSREDGGLPMSVATGRLSVDRRGRLLVPTGGGLFCRRGTGWMRIGLREGLEGETVLSALEDREGSLWLGVAGVGLVQRLGSGEFSAWTRAEGLAHDVVWSIHRAGSALWVGTEQGVSRMDEGGIRSFTKEQGLGGNTVYALASGPNGAVFAGSWPGGVTRFGPALEPRSVPAEGLGPADFRVAALHVSADGALWAGTSRGAYRLAPGGARFQFSGAPGADDERDSVFGFAETAAGELYAVGRYGLQRLMPSPPRRFRRADGLASDFIASVTTSSNGLLIAYREALGAAWLIVTPSGLEVSPLEKGHPLSFAKVVLVGHDAGGLLWLGGSDGVDVLSPGGALLRHYDRTDGLVTGDMSQNAFCPERDGGVWLGTSRGLVRYRPEGLDAKGLPPPIVLTGAWAGDRAIPLDKTGCLGRKERTLLVGWAGLTYRQPGRVRYRYRLLPTDERGVETRLREARFAQLLPGAYRFEVTAISAEGLESSAPAVLDFSVEAAPWETAWARASGWLLALAVGYGAIRLRTRLLETERRRLEIAVVDRSAALAAANAELREASLTDPLTGLRNRRFFTASIEDHAATVRRAYGSSPREDPGAEQKNRDLVFLLVDVDHFKNVNDVYGHVAGDRVLAELAERLKSAVRREDLIIRWGGEEFLVITRGTDRWETGHVALRILEQVGTTPFEVSGHALRVTCSIGWAPFPWDRLQPSASSYEEVLQRADEALYAAKTAGRNQALGVVPEDAKPSEVRRIRVPGPDAVPA